MADCWKALGISRATCFRWIDSGRLQSAGRGLVTRESLTRQLAEQAENEASATAYEILGKWERTKAYKRAVALWCILAGRIAPPPLSFLLFARQFSANSLQTLSAYVIVGLKRGDTNTLGLHRKITDALLAHGPMSAKTRSTLIGSGGYSDAVEGTRRFGVDPEDVVTFRNRVETFAKNIPRHEMARLLCVSDDVFKNRLSRMRRARYGGWDINSLFFAMHRLAVIFRRLSDSELEQRAEKIAKDWLQKPIPWMDSAINPLSEFRRDVFTDIENIPSTKEADAEAKASEDEKTSTIETIRSYGMDDPPSDD